MMCHRDGAVEAFEYVAAVETVEKGVETPSVQEEECLFAGVKRPPDCLYKGSGEDGCFVPRSAFFFHVDDIYVREIPPGHPPGQPLLLRARRPAHRAAAGRRGHRAQ